MKQWIVTLLCTALLAGIGGTVFAQEPLQVLVEEKPLLWTDAAPFLDENGRTLVPLRAVAEALSLTVEWDAAERQARFLRETEESEGYYGIREQLTFSVGNSRATGCVYVCQAGQCHLDDLQIVEMDTAAVIVKDRVYAPLRYLAEFFGYTVEWDEESPGVKIFRQPYRYYYDVYGLGETQVTICFTEGELFSELKGVEVLSAAVNGGPAEVVPMAAEELAAMQARYGTELFFGFHLKWPEKVAGEEVLLQWTVSEQTAAGRSEQSYTLRLANWNPV